MTITKLKLSQIKPYEKNPRRNDEAVDAVAESIRQCGYCQPILVDENNVILAGHTRYKALKKLGWKEAEVVVRDGLTDEQKRKYRLLDNKTNELASWDFDLLTEELDGLDFEGFDFDFGIGTDELPPEPENLDSEEYSAEEKIGVKLIFVNYQAYSEHEQEIKDFAGSVGAEYSVIKG